MQRRLRTEEIYDAALDDAAFEQLPTLMAETYEARSAVLHWRGLDGSAGELADTGYFSDEHMLEYDRHFASADLWAEAVNLPSMANRAWDCEEVIPADIFERSRIYNDWIRQIGDDTFHCVGLAIRSAWGIAEVGLHRGRTQGSFDGEVLDNLNENLQHMRRMLTIRTQLAEADGRGRTPSAALDALANGMLSLTPTGRMLYANASADDMLRLGDGLFLRKNHICARHNPDDRALQKAIAMAADPVASTGTDLRIRRRSGGAYMLSVLAVHAGAAGRQIIVIISNPEAGSSNMEARLRALFGLTASEAHLALRLSEGATATEIAVGRGVTIGTIRVQLKSLAAKLGCGRQAEIVSVVKDLPQLRKQ